jgi:molybdopterin synthase catalytic subunit
MLVQVLFFGVLKDLVGQARESLELPEGATIADVLARYCDRPRMAGFLPSLAISLNQEFAHPDARLHDGDELAFLPPVSGGSAEAEPVRSRARLVQERISPEEVAASVRQPGAGAVVVFDGTVRDNSRGRRTLFLDYEAYAPMALRELEKLAAEARTKFAISEVAVVHRTGRLEIGDSSVVIAVAAPHRGPAFDACRWIIDTLKHTVPIWKKEHFEDGAVWADGEPFPEDQALGSPFAQEKVAEKRE